MCSVPPSRIVTHCVLKPARCAMVGSCAALLSSFFLSGMSSWVTDKGLCALAESGRLKNLEALHLACELVFSSSSCRLHLLAFSFLMLRVLSSWNMSACLLLGMQQAHS